VSDSDKRIKWVGSAKDDLSAFPDDAKADAGYQLERLQKGEDPPHFKPMPGIGQGVAELIVNVGDAFRVFYVARFPEAIYVLHAFNKKTRKTSQRDMEQGQKAYAAVVESRRAPKEKP
jgi:phage-related protein